MLLYTYARAISSKVPTYPAVSQRLLLRNARLNVFSLEKIGHGGLVVCLDAGRLKDVPGV
ncbi:MAG: hypothetical protein P8M78_17855 [Myxococcota bacterium]|jgi:hypothetical protein|nr:hypothetical protein [Myxococcota bacterium]